MVGVAQLVEHLVVVQDVAGSSPVTHPSRSTAGHPVQVTVLGFLFGLRAENFARFRLGETRAASSTGRAADS